MRSSGSLWSEWLRAESCSLAPPLVAGGVTPADIDLMVVVDEGADRRAIAGELYRAMFDAGIGIGVDFVVATEAGFARHRETAGLVYRDISRDGREVYVAA